MSRQYDATTLFLSGLFSRICSHTYTCSLCIYKSCIHTYAMRIFLCTRSLCIYHAPTELLCCCSVCTKYKRCQLFYDFCKSLFSLKRFSKGFDFKTKTLYNVRKNCIVIYSSEDGRYLFVIYTMRRKLHRYLFAVWNEVILIALSFRRPSGKFNGQPPS